MKAEERDKLLTRLDERTCNIWHTIEKLERHQAEQNGFIMSNIKAISRNTTWRKGIAVILGVLISAAITGLFIYLVG